jgi:molybdenum cofactor cytidylyltransferase
MDQLAIIILAAGSSSRLGYPKQLLELNKESLIRRALLTAVKVSNKVWVVLGANAVLLQEEIIDLPVQIVQNNQWEEGMASSIRSGLSSVLKDHPSIDAVIIMVTDQPFVSSSLMNELLEKYQESKKPIVACTYEDSVGVPALFDRLFFPDLLELRGQSGAKKVIEQNMGSVLVIPFPMGHIDIDTEEDYDRFIKMISTN